MNPLRPPSAQSLPRSGGLGFCPASDCSLGLSRHFVGNKGYAVLGVKTPIPFLIDVLGSRPFTEGETYTNFIETHFAEWKPSAPDAQLACIAFIADEMTAKPQAAAGSGTKVQAVTPWQTLGAWRP